MNNDLHTLNGQNKLALLAGRISKCRNSRMAVKTWCRKNGVCEQTYYKLQLQIFALVLAQKDVRFAEVTPASPVRCGNIAATVRMAGVEVDIHSDAATMETVLPLLKSC